MPAVNYFGPGPQTFGPGITWSSTNAFNGGGAVFGFTPGMSLHTTASWETAVGLERLGPMAGLNDSTDDYGVTDTHDVRVSQRRLVRLADS